MTAMPGEQPVKLGIKIAKPIEEKTHPFFGMLAVLAFLLIGATIWLLSLEYLGEPPPKWLKIILENFALTL